MKPPMSENDIVSPQELKRFIDFAYKAHQEHIARPDHDMRQDGKVPYITHLLWCAMMLLGDKTIPFEERKKGYQALLLHDVLEDTSLPLPDDIDPEVKQLVEDMTYDSWEEEKKGVMEKGEFLKLLKLLDKTSTMYDSRTLSRPEKNPDWVKFTKQLLEDVRPRYGHSQVVAVAEAIINASDW